MPKASLLAAGKEDEALTYTPLLQLKNHVMQRDTLQGCLHTDSATVLTFSRGPEHSCIL